MHKKSLDEVILGVAFVTVFALPVLQYEKIGDNQVPTLIFKDKPSSFTAFVLALNFAFTAALMAIYLRERCRRFASHFRVLALVSIATAVAIPMWLVLPSAFELRHKLSAHLDL